MSNNRIIAIIGAGAMAIEHYKVLKALGEEPLVFGRGASSADAFAKLTGHRPFTGDLADNLAACSEQITHAIIAVNVDQLAPVTTAVLDYGVDYVLLEKPGGVDPSEVTNLAKHDKADRVRIAYNRRFLPSTITMQNAILEDGGVTSFHFEFNENIPLIQSLTQHPDRVKENWFYANSTHVTDLAFFLGGRKGILDANIVEAAKIEGDLTAKPANARFAGCGSFDGTVFSYLADWSSAGRWGLEVCTPKRRLIMKPIETVQAINRGSFGMAPVELIGGEPEGVKPGFYNMINIFITDADHEDMLTLKDQVTRVAAYKKMVTLN